jgi:hypothetical protein
MSVLEASGASVNLDRADPSDSVSHCQSLADGRGCLLEARGRVLLDGVEVTRADLERVVSRVKMLDGVEVGWG